MLVDQGIPALCRRNFFFHFEYPFKLRASNFKPREECNWHVQRATAIRPRASRAHIFSTLRSGYMGSGLVLQKFTI